MVVVVVVVPFAGERGGLEEKTSLGPAKPSLGPAKPSLGPEKPGDAAKRLEILRKKKKYIYIYIYKYTHVWTAIPHKVRGRFHTTIGNSK